MIKQVLFGLATAALAAGVCLYPEPTADAATQTDCSGFPGFGSRVQKMAGTALGYPQACYLSSCRLLGYKREIYKSVFVSDPITGGHYETVLAARYVVQPGGAVGLCPADVNAGPWVKP